MGIPGTHEKGVGTTTTSTQLHGEGSGMEDSLYQTICHTPSTIPPLVGSQVHQRTKDKTKTKTKTLFVFSD
ncbi:hypothetical protein CTAM01_07261 [Colletotrichum tamarilloi]|uniref:Uncharacterized protein n=1 Tax=Colletotrichum tamarilloi TaxID=1209934 RepID=A0ABQ9R9V2_9PEZI|nr:uncharacterized protein CTAM01_07261 [Colletotrichum tamarilloi]KAK1498532.1 hypothetical protein CTAM01_07261 [Colletotrichum tamarilloi]